MNLKELISAAQIDTGVARVTVKWSKPNFSEQPQEDGTIQRKKETSTEYEFTAHIVRQLSYGATERIMRAAAMPSLSVGAVVVSESVRFGEAGEDKMDYETANSLHPGLIMALRSEVDKYRESITKPTEQEAKEGGEKKPN